MAAIGQRNTLRVLREAAPGMYLDGETLGEILLPGRYIPKGTVPGAMLDVFVYRDSEDRLVATTERPLAMAGEFASLRVVSTSARMGAFLDWGLSKDLLLPMREQAQPVRSAEWVIAFVFVDPRTGRLVATTRLGPHLDRTVPAYETGQAVRMLIAGKTPLGFKAIVENAHWGLLYEGEIGVPPKVGETLTGYVRAAREDGKLDLGLDPAGYDRVAPLTEQIVAALEAAGGRLKYDDKTAPEVIRVVFDTSKKAFKQALGALYRDRRIRFLSPGIELIKD